MKLKPYTIFAIVAFVLVAILLAISRIAFRNGAAPDSPKLQVAASFYPLSFFASGIAKDKAQIINITPSGAEPHDYEPTPKQIAQLEKSDLLILLGGLEPWEGKVRENLKGKKVGVVVVGGGLLSEQLTENGKTVLDPHIWLSPPLAKKIVEAILQSVIRVDSKNVSFYEKSAKNLESELDLLDNDYRQGLSSCKQKDIITSHAAFGYLAKEYGLNQVAVTGVSPDEEPSAKQLTEVAQFAREHNVKYIFFESLVSPKLSETIASEIGARTLVLDPVEGISEDEIAQGANYFTKMRENLRNLQIALECTQ